MNTKEGDGHDAPFETFNRRFDALFGEDCRDLHGRLHHICQGKLGMGLVVLYLSKINWADFPLDLVELKLQCLIAELQHLQCVPNPLFAIYIDGLLDEWIYLARHEPSISLQSWRTLPTPRRLNFPSSAKLSRISTLSKLTRTGRTILLLLWQQVPTQMHPLQLVQCQLYKTNVMPLLVPTTKTAKKMALLISQQHVCHLRILSLLSHLVHSLQPRRGMPQQLCVRQREGVQCWLQVIILTWRI